MCTADYALSDGTTYPRASIIDEIQPASLRPRLRDRSQILKSPEVLLPSSITPTYDRLDIASPAGAAAVILKQPEAWGLTNPPSPHRAAAAAADPDAGTGSDLRALCDGLRPDDRGEATRRVYRLLSGGSENDGRRIARALHAVAQALLDVAAVKPAAVAADLAERLLEDPDPLVARQAQDVLTTIEHVSDADRAACYARFGL